ncbi:uncharacterized protein LY89DRAFT_675467 [Mollisia scopiformis]|uniref:Uncharacterized protein n=1 Tax=Mollisia scopiformis TaxID=149040 RepID=A0A132BC12_MOLSC|nr:uncharacterized protein LY89DRAFT_675467 [Mollisia scopiformis]KUJ09960.1 hypothetical protein LY89DRAFT_675467 [Mollisia scopiformis]
MSRCPPDSSWPSYNASKDWDDEFFNDGKFKDEGKISCSEKNVAIGSIIKLNQHSLKRHKLYHDRVVCVHKDCTTRPELEKMFQHPAAVLDIWRENGDDWALVSIISSKKLASEGQGANPLTLDRPYDRKYHQDMYNGVDPKDVMHLEYFGGTFERACWFQTNHAWKVMLSMTIPFKKLIWANRLTKASYETLMDRLHLSPAFWVTTKALWVRSLRDPAFSKSCLSSDIQIQSPTSPTPSKASSSPSSGSSPLQDSPPRKRGREDSFDKESPPPASKKARSDSQEKDKHDERPRSYARRRTTSPVPQNRGRELMYDSYRPSDNSYRARSPSRYRREQTTRDDRDGSSRRQTFYEDREPERLHRRPVIQTVEPP